MSLNWRGATLPILVSAIQLAMAYVLWQSPTLTYQEPRWYVPIVAVATIAILRQAVPMSAWVYWMAGVLTLAWSLAPGNTIVYQLWETCCLAALAAGTWRIGFWTLNVFLLGNGLLDALSLNAFGLQSYVSGSIHYVLGAQALVILPLALGYLFRSKSNLSHLGLFLITVLSGYGAMISGARAVYLPLCVVLLLATYRLLRQNRRWILVMGTLMAVAVVLFVGDLYMPGRPMATALDAKASVAAQVRATRSNGAGTQRLRFWDQTISIAVDRPMGAGTGSYQSVIHAYQKYPMVWSNSPHNVFVETAATGGWLRLVVLGILVGWPIIRGWKSDDWPYALGAFGIWTTMAFDVTSYYPSFLMLAFASLGPLYGSPSKAGFGKSISGASPREPRRRVRWLGMLTLIAMVALVTWWYMPCAGTECAVTRYLGFGPKVEEALVRASPDHRVAILADVRKLYPKSLWVIREQQRYASSPKAELALAREVATRFPNQSPQNFLDWANAAVAANQDAEAVAALQLGLEVFPANDYPFGERRLTHESYDAWVNQANSLLSSLQP